MLEFNSDELNSKTSKNKDDEVLELNQIKEDFFLSQDCLSSNENSESDNEYVPDLVEIYDSDSDFEESNVTLENNKKKNSRKRKNPFKKKIHESKKLNLEDIESDFEIDDEIVEYTELDNGYKLPSKIWNRLYPFQQAGIKWLWELHQLSCGGIIGDEMGLGKTIQVISFLYGLSISNVYNFREKQSKVGPVLIICPATLMHQWVNELDIWYPHNKVTILHHTSPYKGPKRKLLNLITKLNGILITSYTTITLYQDMMYDYDWHYIILDEGHKIRNPDAQVTLAVKRFKTPHRIILTGSPIQNNLKELWSLFDFVYPGKLGTLPVFLEQFSVPITQGGYANASKIQVQIAYKCALVLRDTIKPFLLRRLKEDVKLTLCLPSKNEQVLFCKLTNFQRETYLNYIKTINLSNVSKKATKMFVGLINLRKICNHPDLFEKTDFKSEDYFGNYKRSGKMKVLNSLLKEWHKQDHKVLIFVQGCQMLNILEIYLKKKQYTYLIMDGSTSINQRPQLIKQFNTDSSIFIFLLTTRVGGLGINLTGANRIIIYDPDWNPSTDMQARERAWRIGQNREVTIFRFLTMGTVEEKIYHRQIFKQYLTNKILKNPKQRRFFKTNDLYDLFTLADDDSKRTESSDIFAGTGSEIRKKKKKAKKDINNCLKEENEIVLSPEKIEELKERAKRLSKIISNKFNLNNLNENDLNKSETTSKNNEQNFKENESLLNKKLKKKINNGIIFEGKKIKYLAKYDKFKDNFSNEDEKKIGKKQNDYILKKLFKNSSLHSALQHDVIEQGNVTDYMIVEDEAEKVANEAILALKKSREMCLSANSGLPNWTGSNGYTKAKKEINRPAFGKVINLNQTNSFPQSGSSSNLLLNTIKERNNITNLNNSSSVNNFLNNNLIHNDLLQDMRAFIAFQSKKNGEATTEELLERFTDKLPENSSALFRALLHKLCDFERNSNGIGVWILKNEFR